MRTTVRLDDALLMEAKKLAADTNRTLTTVIEDAVREAVNRRKVGTLRKHKTTLPVFKGRGLQPGVDLDDSSALLDIMDGLT